MIIPGTMGDLNASVANGIELIKVSSASYGGLGAADQDALAKRLLSLIPTKIVDFHGTDYDVLFAFEESSDGDKA